MRAKLIEVAPQAKRKIAENNGDVSRLTREQICVILFIDHKVDMKGNIKKDVLIAKLNSFIKGEPNVTVGGSGTTATMDGDDGGEEEDDNIDMEGVLQQAPSGNHHYDEI